MTRRLSEPFLHLFRECPAGNDELLQAVARLLDEHRTAMEVKLREAHRLARDAQVEAGLAATRSRATEALLASLLKRTERPEPKRRGLTFPVLTLFRRA